MGYVDENLLPNERIVYQTKLHWRIYLPASIFALLFLLTLTGDRDASPVAIVMFIIAALLGIVAFIRMKTSEFAVTNKRVLIKVGFISRKTIELLLQKIETVGGNQGIIDRILTSGSIVIVGTGGTKEHFKSIANPMEFRRQVHGQLAV